MQAKDIFVKALISQQPEEDGWYKVFSPTDANGEETYLTELLFSNGYWHNSDGTVVDFPEQYYGFYLLPMKQQFVLSYEEMNEFVRQMRIVRNHEASGINKFTYPKFDHYLKAHPQPYNLTPEEDREVRGF